MRKIDYGFVFLLFISTPPFHLFLVFPPFSFSRFLFFIFPHYPEVWKTLQLSSPSGVRGTAPVAKAFLCILSFKVASSEFNIPSLPYKILCNRRQHEMREIKLKQAEKREVTENAWDSSEMLETWQRCFCNPPKKDIRTRVSCSKA